jgi:hypothetical protein
MRFNSFPLKAALMILPLSWTSGFSKYPENTAVHATGTLYDSLNLSQAGLSKEVFQKAVTGWNKLGEENSLKKRGVLSIADLSQSSRKKRLYVIDMISRKLLFNTYVAHGRNSGEEFASKFSNVPESFMTSLGFYVTGETYSGKHGLSMKLIGVEKNINDVAESRSIVLHGADYVSETFIRQHGRLGRSYGCPAVAQEVCEDLIHATEGGSVLFIYHPDRNYANRSTLL